MGMFSSLFGSSASATGGLFSAAGGAIFGNKASKNNKKDAAYYTDQMKWAPGNMSTGGTNVTWDPTNNNVTGSLSPELQGLQGQLYGGAGGFLGNLGGLSQTGGMNPYLMSTMNQFDRSAPYSTANQFNPYINTNTQGPQYDPNQLNALTSSAFGAAGQAAGQLGQGQIQTGMGDQFNQASQGFLGGLGSFDPNQAAQTYSQNLRAQAAPGQQLAAENMAQNLFNSGRLGSTGGANLFGQLVQAQNQQDLGFQQAGRDYAGQEQSRLAGLAQGFGSAGTGINAQYAGLNSQIGAQNMNNFLGAAGQAGGLNNQGFNQQVGLNDLAYNRNYGQSSDNYNRAITQNQMSFDQGNQRAQQRFQNAMNIFGGGQQNLQTQAGIGTGLLSAGQGMDQNTLNAIMSSGNLAALRSGVQQQAYAPLYDASVARNNQKLAAVMGGIGAVNNFATTTSSGLGSIFDMYMGGGMGGMGGGMMGGMMGG